MLRILHGHDHAATIGRLPNDAILVARNMGAAELLGHDPKKLRGLVIEDGGATAHVAIVARSFNLPVLYQVADATTAVDHGNPAILDTGTPLDQHVDPVGSVHRRQSSRFLAVGSPGADRPGWRPARRRGHRGTYSALRSALYSL
ncbi:MAG: PEP-utilizing enzyme [Streptosporangiaceae bacterium]